MPFPAPIWEGAAGSMGTLAPRTYPVMRQGEDSCRTRCYVQRWWEWWKRACGGNGRGDLLPVPWPRSALRWKPAGPYTSTPRRVSVINDRVDPVSAPWRKRAAHVHGAWALGPKSGFVRWGARTPPVTGCRRFRTVYLDPLRALRRHCQTLIAPVGPCAS